MADHVFVASSFTCKTLENFPGPKPGISIIPYGFPTANFHPRSYYSRGPIKLLFVGGLSQRKGIANVLEAVDAFEDYVELTIVGRKPSNDCKPLNEALKKHRYYSSLPNDGILQLMREHDVLVFPSLFEGFGLVISEAMSQGTPVITTDRTAGGDLIKHGENGWLVEAGSTEALVEVIEQLITQPGEISRCGAEALKTASMRPWSVYSAELAAKVAKVTPSNN
jgi:glycosyltransferase involved in cell wall biosynthesis